MQSFLGVCSQQEDKAFVVKTTSNSENNAPENEIGSAVEAYSFINTIT